VTEVKPAEEEQKSTLVTQEVTPAQISEPVAEEKPVVNEQVDVPAPTTEVVHN